jgi:hypothetical protein
MHPQALSKMAAVVGNDSATIASLCADAATRLPTFDTQSLTQLFCAIVKHARMPQFASFVSRACQQLTVRVASMDGTSAGCLAGALATALQNVPETESCHDDLQSCLVTLCSRWLLPPSLVLGPQHTAFMCRCLVSSLVAVQKVIGNQMSIREIQRRVLDAVSGMVSEMNWFCIAHVELLLILLSNGDKSNLPEGSWLPVPRKCKSILKASRQRMFDVTSSMLCAYGSFDREAAGSMLDSLADLPLHGAVLMCGGGGPGNNSDRSVWASQLTFLHFR